mgnify:CR=1 FL=1
MARIAGVNIPTQKRVEIALTYIHGIGRTMASNICQQVGIPRERRVNELSDAEVLQIREQIDTFIATMERGFSRVAGVEETSKGAEAAFEGNDDDAARMYKLFSQGARRAWLLSSFDKESVRTWGSLVDIATGATGSNGAAPSVGSGALCGGTLVAAESAGVKIPQRVEMPFRFNP